MTTRKRENYHRTILCLFIGLISQWLIFWRKKITQRKNSLPTTLYQLKRLQLSWPKLLSCSMNFSLIHLNPQMSPFNSFLFVNMKKWRDGKIFPSNEIITETNAYFPEFEKTFERLKEVGKLSDKVYEAKRRLSF